MTLTRLHKDKTAVSWLFEKYYNMAFVDKNPEADEVDAEILEDESLWEHRRIINIVWSRRVGHVVDTVLIGDETGDNNEQYFIDQTLIEMIRASPHNTCRMKILVQFNNANPTVTPATPSDPNPDSDSDTSSGDVADV